MSVDSVADDLGPDERAQAIISHMLAKDTFSRWLGIETVAIAPGLSTLRMTVRDDMMNGLGGVHGGIVYSFADSAFSYATNNTGVISVAIDYTVSYPAAVRVGDVLTAVAEQESGSNRLAFCRVTVRNQRNDIVGHFRGTVYRTLKPHLANILVNTLANSDVDATGAAHGITTQAAKTPS